MVRIAGAIVVGIMAGLAVILVFEWLGHTLFPLPAEAGLRNPEAAGQIAAAIPLPARLFAVLSWFAGAFAGGTVAAAIGRRHWLAWIIAALVAASAILNILMIPHPVWMQIAAVAAPLFGGLFAGHLGDRLRGRTAA